MTTFKRATKIDLFDKDGNLWKLKGVVNEENTKEYFNTVSDGYNIVQHEEVMKLVDDAIKDKNLNAVTKINNAIKDNGARLHIELTFPDITLDIEDNGQKVALRCTYDNSYDGSTGLRLQVGAKSPYGEGFLWVGGLVKALEDNYYHKHTKNVNVAEFEKKLEKGIDSFQTKIRDHFLQMVKVSLTENQIESFLDICAETKHVTKNYIELIKEAFKKTTLKNKWQLYCLICDVLTKEASSIDVRDRQLSLIIGRLHKTFKSKDIKGNSPSSGGVESLSESKDLPEVLEIIKNETTPQKLTIVKKDKRKFKVLKEGTEIKTFKKYNQALNFIRQAS